MHRPTPLICSISFKKIYAIELIPPCQFLSEPCKNVCGVSQVSLGEK